MKVMVNFQHVTSELSLMALLSISSCSSVDRAPVQCLGGHGFNFLSGTQIFSLSHARVIVDHFIFHIYLLFLKQSFQCGKWRNTSKKDKIYQVHKDYSFLKQVINFIIITITKFWNLIGSWHALFFAELEHAQLKCPITNCTITKFGWYACVGSYLPPYHDWNVPRKSIFLSLQWVMKNRNKSSTGFALPKFYQILL